MKALMVILCFIWGSNFISATNGDPKTTTNVNPRPQDQIVCSQYDLERQVAACLGIDASNVRSVSNYEYHINDGSLTGSSYYGSSAYPANTAQGAMDRSGSYWTGTLRAYCCDVNCSTTCRKAVLYRSENEAVCSFRIDCDL